mgnify:FL=1|tara:strand:+ start:515 stop:1567 length:1053 start_codon:yes stop_codon:yes gene_type:complete
MRLKKLFLDYCKINNFEINKNQVSLVESLNNYYKENFNQSFLKRFFKKKNYKFGFYLSGDVGVGKTMILNFFFELLKEKKLRLHFNEFMLNFHDYIHKNKNTNKNNSIEDFVKDLRKKVQILYFDEFQVTNIVDAMILGKLFEKIFDEKIRVIFTSNIKIENLYKDGLQREQFLPFIKILKEKSYEKELLINEDYRTSKNKNSDRFLFPLNQSTNFKFNKFFRKVTKNKKQRSKFFDIKGRKLEFRNYYEGIFRLDFKDICDKNLGAEDYIRISESSNFIFIENLPNFNENNSNQQHRFITLIDVIYEKKIPLMITSESDLYSIKSSKSLSDIFKRTTSRLFELTSLNYN